MKLSKKFKNLRRKLDVSQAELGSLLSLSPGSIYKYESGKVIPRADVLSRLEGLVKKKGTEMLNDEVLDNNNPDYFISNKNMIQLLNLQCEKIRKLEKEIESFNKNKKDIDFD